MAEPRLNITKRNLPHWTLDDATYFVTFRILRGMLTERERRIVLDHIRSGHSRYYLLAAAVVMPDHVHLILRTFPEFDLPRIMKGIKGASARKLNAHRGSSGPVWQDESWDRIIRDAADFEEKLHYMADNPVKAGLTEGGIHYCAWYCDGEIC